MNYIIIIIIIIIIIVIFILFSNMHKYKKNYENYENKEINIILVSINKFQEYILYNIKQLINLGHKNIYIITNEKFFNNFNEYKNNIILIKSEDLNNYNYDVNSSDFWYLTSLRFIYIYELMKLKNLKNVFHLENDVVIYYNCNTIIDKLDNYMYIPFDTFNRNIASFIYIPNHELFKKIIDVYDFSINDMLNFPIIQKKTGLIDNFPIIIEDNNENEEYKFVSKNFNKFNFIFDAAAIGQYLGGIDPIHNTGNTIGYVNPDCIIKYNNYTFEWKTIDNMKKPFIIINNKMYPVFNLHIHSKSLDKFIN